MTSEQDAQSKRQTNDATGGGDIETKVDWQWSDSRIGKWKWPLLFLGMLLVGFFPTTAKKFDVAVGSKKFTESVILGELLRLSAEDVEIETVHFPELGGTQIVYQGLISGEIDIYAEYTGTLALETLQMDSFDRSEVERRIAEQGLKMSAPLGFNNSYALGMKREQAESMGIQSISDLASFPQLKLRFGVEFVERKDGWGPLSEHYGLTHTDVLGIDHDVAYRQLDAGVADVIDVYTTDSKIKLHDIVVLEDDRNFFPRYEAILLYRADLVDRFDEFESLIARMESSIFDERMIQMNSAAELERIPAAVVAAEFLKEQFGVESKVQTETLASRLARTTIGHLNLVRTSLVAAILFAVPLGVLAAKMRPLRGVILATVGMLQTIPGLALLVLLIAPVEALGLSSFGSGSAPVLIALFVYSLLPIVHNTYAGLSGIPHSLQESAQAMGLSASVRLFQIELPMASGTILAGIKTAAVINVGFAMFGALIGAPGYGQPIFSGIRLADTRLILEGAIPAALMAVAVQLGFTALELVAVPKGIRKRFS